MSVLLQVLVADFIIQIIGWAYAVLNTTEKYYDFTGSLTFFSLSLFSVYNSSKHPRQVITSIMVISWTVRLGTYLLRRILKAGKDRRFDEVKTKPLRFLIYWLIQGVWVFVCALPVFLVNTNSSEPGLNLLDVIGWLVYLAGLAIETVSDYQKDVFRSNPANHDKFISSGLWKLSRHPNYFGEIVVWWGVWLSCLSGQASFWLIFISSTSPLFVMFLLTRVSGIPLLERDADKRWGSREDYQEYKRTTSVLIPRLPSS
eukprot:TRINITY_DN1703_c0_g1_i2.p1 TRINITY_DN1703_c0_g1~~TRINITY_DN1703_c0_g1_i2.p1  ORF type:complete len:258 (-),score=14.05 TRINITY_DN1703_c0_g1_i2:90-863(-)